MKTTDRLTFVGKIMNLNIKTTTKKTMNSVLHISFFFFMSSLLLIKHLYNSVSRFHLTLFVVQQKKNVYFEMNFIKYFSESIH